MAVKANKVGGTMNKKNMKWFNIGASITSGRVFWVGEGGETNKTFSSSLSSDGKIASVKVGGAK